MESSIQVSNHNVNCLLPSPDGSVVVSWCTSYCAQLPRNFPDSSSSTAKDGFIRFYRSNSAMETGKIAHDGVIISMCWAKTQHARQVLVCLCSDGMARLWHMDSYSPAPDLCEVVVNSGNAGGIPIQGGIVTSDPDGTQLAIGSPGRLTVWNLEPKSKSAAFLIYLALLTCTTAPVYRAGFHTPRGSQQILHIQFLSEDRILVFFKQPGNMSVDSSGYLLHSASYRPLLQG